MDDKLREEMVKTIMEQIGSNPEILKTLLGDLNLEESKEEVVPVKSYRIDFTKVTSFEELLKVLQHLNFVLSGPPEYFDQYCQHIKPYLVEIEQTNE